MLLSSVRGDGAKVVDPHSYIGLQLVAPLALVSTLQELASRAGRGTAHGVLQRIIQGMGALVDIIDKLDDFLPPKYQFLTELLKALDLKAATDKGVEYFRHKQEAAARGGRLLDAVAASMMAEMVSDEAQRAYFRNQG